MDNNSNNNLSGFSNVNDIKFDDTPAESFDNLYGNSSNQVVSNVTASQSNMVPNSGMNPGMVQPNMAQNPGMNPGMVQPNMSPNPGINPGMVQPNMVPNPGMNPGMVQPNMASNPGMNPGMVQPNMAQNPGMNPGMVQSNMVSNQEINPGMGQTNMASNPGMVQPNVTLNSGMSEPDIVPNPGTIIQPQVEDLSSIDINAERMQSIEEQLSKTSQYNPEDIQKEMISISTDNKSDKNKSGLAFVIVLFIILALVIAFLPQITKFIK